MFSFLKFLNSKSDTEKNTVSNSLNGKTLNLNSPEARTLNIFNTKSPIARKLNGNEYSLRYVQYKFLCYIKLKSKLTKH